MIFFSPDKHGYYYFDHFTFFLKNYSQFYNSEFSLMIPLSQLMDIFFFKSERGKSSVAGGVH